MNKDKRSYDNPLVTRYASREMSYNFSPDKKFKTWRMLWVALADAERQLGLPITKKQINQMKKFINNINYKEAEKIEKKTKHDVMAHIKAYAKQCPLAAPIIHLGATSAYVVDNTDLILIRDGLKILKEKLIRVIKQAIPLALKYASTPALAYTHLQPAQPTTVGKRICLWLYDLVIDLEEINHRISQLKFHGVKGATGTQASFLKLFNGDIRKVRRLEEIITRKMGFEEVYPVTGQTYPRKVDAQILHTLANIAQSAYKFTNDIRILQHAGEVEEGFEEEQVGSTAMPYKKNPILSERIASLARYVITLSQNAVLTAAGQFFERTLDDSAGKRIYIPEAFMATDAILELYLEVLKGLKINKEVIKARLEAHLPFMITENILMEAVKKGGDRQKLHQELKEMCLSAWYDVKKGNSSDLIKKFKQNKHFKDIDIDKLLCADELTGLSAHQTKWFIKNLQKIL